MCIRDSHDAAAKVDRETDITRFIEACKGLGPNGGTAPEIGFASVPDDLLRVDTKEFVEKRQKYAERIRKRQSDAKKTGRVFVATKRDGFQVYVHIDFANRWDNGTLLKVKK